MSSFVRDLVCAIPVDQPPSSDHLVRSLNAANRTTAAGVVDPASSGNEISVELSLTQRSDPRLFHLPSTASEMKVPKARNMRSLFDPGLTLHIAANEHRPHHVPRDHGWSGTTVGARCGQTAPTSGPARPITSESAVMIVPGDAI